MSRWGQSRRVSLSTSSTLIYFNVGALMSEQTVVPLTVLFVQIEMTSLEFPIFLLQ